MAKQRITTDKLRKIAETIRQIASEYDSIAIEAEEMGLESLDIPGIDTLFKALIPRVQSNANNVRKSLTDARIEHSARSMEEEDRTAQPLGRKRKPKSPEQETRRKAN